MTSLSQLKKELVASGFEIFRTLPGEVVLAERVRENLILDSGVRLGIVASGFCVRVVLGALRADFPTEPEPMLFERVRRLAEPALASGFAEISTHVNPIRDPAYPERILDTSYEVSFTREVASFSDAVPWLQFALSLQRTVSKA
ncbi:MAG: hypothetical protein FWD73_05610 [Polyangiaceae bacterium]|nr:hypothetical protein [Polyangiaceae bacterium]